VVCLPLTRASKIKPLTRASKNQTKLKQELDKREGEMKGGKGFKKDQLRPCPKEEERDERRDGSP
jgi:hypothetical protein